MSEPVVRVNCLRHVYPDRTEVSLCGLELEVRPGEITAVLAANGAGKTTLLQHITGMLKPVEGSVRVFGLDPYKDFEKVRTRLGVVFQNPAEQIIGPTVKEDIAFGLGHLKLTKAELDTRVMEELERLGIGSLASKVPHYLSGGEIKKVALAGALAPGPDLLILDEPFAELDPWAIRDLVALLKRVNRESGMAVIFTSHQLEPAAMLADTVVVLDRGHVVARGEPNQVFQAHDVLEKSRLRAPELFRLADLLAGAGMVVEPDIDVVKVAARILAASAVGKIREEVN